MKYELRAYSFSETINQGIKLFFDNFIFCILVSLIVNIPSIILDLLVVIKSGIDKSTSFITFTLLTIIVALNSTILMSGIIIHIIPKKYLNEKIKLKDYLAVLPLLLPLIALILVQGIGIIIGIVFLIVPGVILSLTWSVSAVTLVIEKTGIFKALYRSSMLTKGKKGHIFLLFLFITIVEVILISKTDQMVTFMNFDEVITILLKHIISAAIVPIQSCILVILYFNLRVEKEGFNIENLAEYYNIKHINE